MGHKTHPYGYYTPACAIFHYYQITNIIFVSTEKTTLEELGGVYVGVWAAPTPPHSGPTLVVDFFQWIH